MNKSNTQPQAGTCRKKGCNAIFPPAGSVPVIVVKVGDTAIVLGVKREAQ